MRAPCPDLEAALRGDRAAQERLFADLYPLVRKQMAFALGFSPLVDEAVQESLIEIYRSLHTYRGEAAFSTWALRIAVRTGRRFVRKERRDPASPEIAAELTEAQWNRAGEPAEPASPALHALVRGLMGLAPKKREAFIVMELLGITAAEAGHALGIPPNTAASRCRHAKLELRRALPAWLRAVHAEPAPISPGTTPIHDAETTTH
jgi:RNA polymerase sigma-70 factor, ECF subfamily